MTPIRRFGLLHLLTPVLAALPCLHTRMGDTSRTFSLFSLLTQAQVAPSARALTPYILYTICCGIGASFIFRGELSARTKRVALVAAWLGFVALIDLGKPAYTFAKQTTLPFLPPIHFYAGAGLWGLLLLQLCVLRAAHKLPVGSTAAVR